MSLNNIKHIHDFGQSIWLDFIDRKLIKTGALKKLIDEDGIRGITSNPAIFEKAISGSDDYDEDIKQLAEEEKSDDDIFYSLAIADIQHAADVFKPLYNEGKVKGADGYVSLEVSPRLARDTEGTRKQASELWKKVSRENVLIKIPATAEGLPAIRDAIKNGISINVTLLFGLEQYKKVTEAYIAGLEDRIKNNLPVDTVSSVASFFLSRIDVMVDPLLKEKGLNGDTGKTAIACAKKAYEIYKQVFSSDRFKKLEEKGAKPQRLLWASTSSKDPAFKDTMYVEALIGKNTVNTIPMETLEAFRDHGIVADTLEKDLDKASDLLQRIEKAGINMKQVSEQLENEGINKFNKPYDKLLASIQKQKDAVQA